MKNFKLLSQRAMFIILLVLAVPRSFAGGGGTTVGSGNLSVAAIVVSNVRVANARALLATVAANPIQHMYLMNFVVAQHLLSSGVEEICLIDPQTLKTESFDISELVTWVADPVSYLVNIAARFYVSPGNCEAIE